MMHVFYKNIDPSSKIKILYVFLCLLAKFVRAYNALDSPSTPKISWFIISIKMLISCLAGWYKEWTIVLRSIKISYSISVIDLF